MLFINRCQNILKKVNLATLRKHYCLIGILLFSLILRLFWLKTLIQRDEGGAGYVAMLWSQGYLPYVYSLDNKPPLHYFIYLIFISLFGNTIIPIRIFNNILFLVSIVVLYLVAKDWYGKKVSILGALIYGIFMNAPVFEGQLALSEPLSVPLVIFSIYFCNRYLRSGRNYRLFISGILMSVSSLILQIQVVGIILLCFMVLFSKRGSSDGSKQHNFKGNRVADLFILAVGISFPVLIVMLYFWSYKALDDLIECLFFRLFRVYLAHGDVTLGHKLLIILEGLPLWLLSILGCIKCILRLNKYDKFLLIWILLFLSVAAIPPQFGHHYSLIIAPASILAGVTLSSVSANVKFAPNRKFFTKYRKSALSLFIIVLTLSFIPSIMLQAKQYPNYNIEWGVIWWYYADMPSYNQQIELANFLKSHAPNEEILIHGWDPQTYWLSGHRAPSKYVYTIRVGFDIPEEEYYRIVEKIRNGDFEFIVILAREQDPITNSTYQRYFYVKQIGNAYIFSKYNYTF